MLPDLSIVSDGQKLESIAGEEAILLSYGNFLPLRRKTDGDLGQNHVGYIRTRLSHPFQQR